MSISLIKGDRAVIGYQKLQLGLGWKPAGQEGVKFDLDSSVFMLDANKTIPSEEFFVFYGNPSSPCGSVTHSGDDRTGGNSDGGDDEKITIDFTKIDPRIEEIIIVATIDQGKERNQNFGQVRESRIRLVNLETNTQEAMFELEEEVSIATGVEFGRIYKKDGGWKFDACGIGHKEDLAFFLARYYQGAIEK